jgi:hypothetical protein
MTVHQQRKQHNVGRQSSYFPSATGKTKAAIIASPDGLGYAQVKDFLWRDAIEKYSDYFIRY